MDRQLGIAFAKTLKGLEGRAFIDALVAVNAAPTIRGKKPASLLNFNIESKNARQHWKQFGEAVCSSYQLDYFLLKEDSQNLLILLYRKPMLNSTVNHRRNRLFMQKMGYKADDNLEKKLHILKHRFSQICPHEVGIFLGMPVEDVEGFIHHGGQNCIYCRYWKVYDNIKRAELLFSLYDQARAYMASDVLARQMAS